MREPSCAISFRYDAPEAPPCAVAEELAEIAHLSPLEEDSYMLGGTVAKFEEAFAALLGMERAVLMPTGTLANHLAVRALAKGRSRVIVQERGHLYNDSGDCLQRLSGFNVVPLGRDQATFSLEEVQAATRVAEASRVRVEIGALVIETPVRRKQGELFNHQEMQRICAYAREHGIGLHLDGARLFIAAAYTGISVPAYAAEFDTVYISLYKYFGTPCGAMLAGPAALLDGIHHERRMFGGALSQAWPFAAPALQHMSSFSARFARVIEVSEAFKERLRSNPGFLLTDIPNGTNICRLELSSRADPRGFGARLKELGIRLPSPENGAYFLKMNESMLAMPADDLAQCFSRAL